MKWLWAGLVIILLALQWRLWVGEDSLAELSNLRDKIQQQTEKNEELRTRNQQLDAEVLDLKQGLEAIEERARSELGMIKDNETFFQLVQPPSMPVQTKTNPSTDESQ